MQRHQPTLAGLALHDVEHTGFEIDVLTREPQCLTDSQTCRGEQTEQGLTGVRSHATVQRTRGLKQRSDFLSGVDVWLPPTKHRTEQSGWRHLRAWVFEHPVLRKHAHGVQTPRTG